jgi:hypothetical protein
MDLSWIAFDEAKKTGEGQYEMKKTFPIGGNYVLYVHFTPKDGERQIFPIAYQVGGRKHAEVRVGNDMQKVLLIDGYSVKLQLAPAADADAGTELKFVVTKGGKPADATAVDAFIVSRDTTTVVDAHPDKGPSFHAHFPQPGTYKVWAHLKMGGSVKQVALAFPTK